MKKVIGHEPNLSQISKKNHRFVLLDTSFILTCIKQKIDFFEQLESEGFRIIIPKQVIYELEKIASSKQKLHFRENANSSLKLLKKSNFKKIDLKTKAVDAGLIKFAKGNPKTIIATLDRELKKKIQNPKLVIRGKKKLEII